jgi:hypothetical protein
MFSKYKKTIKSGILKVVLWHAGSKAILWKWGAFAISRSTFRVKPYHEGPLYQDSYRGKGRPHNWGLRKHSNLTYTEEKMKYHILRKAHAFVLALAVVFVTIAHAENHHSLTPLLVDLPGWEAEKPEVMSMDMGAMKMTNATRSYTKDNKEITAVVMLGNNAMTQGQMQEMKAESTDVKASISKIDGFQVHTSYDKNENSGSVVVFLAQSQTQGALFIVSYEGLSEKEALSLAKKFNWKKMRAAVEKLF